MESINDVFSDLLDAYISAQESLDNEFSGDFEYAAQARAREEEHWLGRWASATR